MLFKYIATDQANAAREGTIDAANIDIAITSLQRRGYTVSSIDPLTLRSSFWEKDFTFFEHISTKDVVIFSRQISTLFEAQVSALRVFRLLAAESDNPLLARVLEQVADDIQGGSSISAALTLHPSVFSTFYVSMVHAGEESGKLSEAFIFLADYLDRTYEVMSKARNAFIYPAFVIATFIAVMTLMMTLVIPKLSAIIEESGQEIPIYTKIVIAISNVMTHYIGFVILFLSVGIFFLWRFSRTEVGARTQDELKLSLPYVGGLYKKLYLSRICDGLSTMLESGISMLVALEVVGKVVDNRVYKELIENVSDDVRSGRSVSDSFGEYPQIPGVMVQMMKIGEESASLGSILTTLAKFYRREVDGAVDTMISLIEPAMIVLLGLGVGTLLASVLIPIYNIANAV